MEKTWFTVPVKHNSNGKAIMAPMEYVLKFYSSNPKGLVLRNILFRRDDCHGKRQKKYSIKDTMSIKISFMYYMKWTRVMLLVLFGEFEVVHIFLLLFSFYYHCRFTKGQL